MAKSGRIVMRVSPNSVKRFADATGAEIEKLNRFSRSFAGALADAVASMAEENFEYAEYDGVNDAKVYVNQDKRNRYTVIAEGESVPFIEYGTGVTFEEPYPGDIPARFSGRYGKGNGEKDFWFFAPRPGVEMTAGGEWPELRPHSRLAPRVREEVEVPIDSENPYKGYKKVMQLVRPLDEEGEYARVPGNGKEWYRTEGNAPNACMYNAFKTIIEDDYNDILDEVRDAEL